ncbi:hypothetical protein [Escherichia phage vB_EcoM_TU01]|nr:hypothetical protein [Escherichia phage vB_EcoM_TU01]
MSSVNYLITGFKSRRFVQTLTLVGGNPDKVYSPFRKVGAFLYKYSKQ